MNEKEMKKIGKTALSVILAGSFAFSPVLASADELNGQQVNTAEKAVTVPTDININSGTVQAKDGETPSLVPGDFFYFVKVALEKIRLAITFDDNKEAALLAGFAAERLAEAEELFKSGKEEKAIETIKDAIEYMKEAEIESGEKADEDDQVKEEEQEKKDEASEDQVKENVQAKDDEASKDQVKEEGQVKEDKDSNTEDQVKEGDQVEDDTADIDQDKLDQVTGERTPAEELAAHNIIALKAALEHVQNPKARAALQKNIEKTYEKLAKRLQKIEEMAEKEAAKEELKNEAKTDKEKHPHSVKTNDDLSAIKENETKTTTKTVPVKEAVKRPANEAKEALKQEKKTAKETSKIEKKAVKETQKNSKKEQKPSARPHHNKKNGEHEKKESHTKGNNYGKSAHHDNKQGRQKDEGNKGKNNSHKH